MPFKPSIVALPVDPISAPYLGFPLTEIILEQDNGEGSALPALPTPDARDKITEAVTGSDVRVNRRKLTDVEFDIDFISADKKALIERLYHDGRSVYLSPNFGPHTMWSFPLQRSTDDFLGNKTMATVRDNENHEWDDVDKVFRSFAIDEPSIVFNGAWSRYFRSHADNQNFATKPHPDSTSTGWTVSSGSATISYTEDIKTPLLSNRIVTNAKGITLVDTTSGQITHISTNGLTTTETVACSFAMAWTGVLVIQLKDVGGATVYDSGVFNGDGTFQLIRLSGANSNATNNAEIVITFTNIPASSQIAMIGPVFIGNGSTSDPGRFPDWSDGGALGTDITAITDTLDNLLAEATFSFFLKWSDTDNGIVRVGGTPNITILKTSAGGIAIQGFTVGTFVFNGIDTEFGIGTGDWVHCAITFGSNGANLYINGVGHSDNGTLGDWNPDTLNQLLYIGNNGNNWNLDNSGLSHVRCDSIEWTADEALDHYDTYFRSFGRGIIEPTFGKEMIIGEMEWETRPGGPDGQWIGHIVLRELGVESEFAPMQRQEDV